MCHLGSSNPTDAFGQVLRPRQARYKAAGDFWVMSNKLSGLTSGE